MTLQLVFLTITIAKRKYSREELASIQLADKIEEEIATRKFSLYRPIQ